MVKQACGSKMHFSTFSSEHEMIYRARNYQVKLSGIKNFRIFLKELLSGISQ